MYTKSTLGVHQAFRISHLPIQSTVDFCTYIHIWKGELHCSSFSHTRSIDAKSHLPRFSTCWLVHVESRRGEFADADASVWKCVSKAHHKSSDMTRSFLAWPTKMSAAAERMIFGGEKNFCRTNLMSLWDARVMRQLYCTACDMNLSSAKKCIYAASPADC